MPTEDLDTSFRSILSGQLPGSELVIGLVGAVGANLKNIVADFTKCLDKHGYSTQEVHVSDLIEDLTEIPPHDPTNKFERINALMTAGNTARKSTGKNAILALRVVYQIYGQRDTDEKKVQPQPRQAYIINSLKHPDEVDALRRIYGSGFLLLGVYVEPEKRKELLRVDMSKEQADELMLRDEAEGPKHGQRTRDVFHLSDFFAHLRAGNEDEERKTQATLERFLDIIFADPYRTPLFDEYAMFMASAAATRSADLSRQIGAVIARDDEILATGANDCPRAGGGTYWPYLNEMNHVVDVEKGRDYKLGYDTNDENKARIIDDAVKEMKKAWEREGKDATTQGDWELLKVALKSSPIDDITEYGRVVHAEMDALLTCARNSISCRGATLYTTTYPCHNCAKHVIAAGIKRVVYVEPYPKSKALEFHPDSAFAGFENARKISNNRVVFEPFVGVGPRRFFDLFSMKQGSGFPLKRKDETTGKVLTWDSRTGIMRIPELPWSYLRREEIATTILKEYLKGESNVQPGQNRGATTETDTSSDASSDGKSV
jgi:deoxycytidylate deaminase